MFQNLVKLTLLCVEIFSRLTALAPLLARVVLGTVFVQAGWGKFSNLPKTIGFFASIGLPYAELQAPMVASFELLGGIAILMGLATRFACIPLTVIMLVALSTAHRADISSISDLFGISVFLYIVLFFWLAVHGPGPISVDALLKRQLAK